MLFSTKTKSIQTLHGHKMVHEQSPWSHSLRSKQAICFLRPKRNASRHSTTRRWMGHVQGSVSHVLPSKQVIIFLITANIKTFDASKKHGSWPQSRSSESLLVSARARCFFWRKWNALRPFTTESSELPLNFFFEPSNALMDPDVAQLRQIGHEIGEGAVAGKFPKRNVGQEVSDILTKHFVSLADPKQRFLCKTCSWSTVQKGYCRPLEHVCLADAIKENQGWALVILIKFLFQWDIPRIVSKSVSNHAKNAFGNCRKLPTSGNMAWMRTHSLKMRSRHSCQSIRKKGTERILAHIP